MRSVKTKSKKDEVMAMLRAIANGQSTIREDILIREEHDKLEKRVTKIEKKLSLA